MSEMSDSDCVFLFNVGEKGTLVVDLEVENSVLIGKFEACGVDSRESRCNCVGEG